MNTLESIRIDFGRYSIEVKLYYRTPQRDLKHYAYTASKKQLDRLEDFINDHRTSLKLDEIILGTGWAIIDLSIC